MRTLDKISTQLAFVGVLLTLFVRNKLCVPLTIIGVIFLTPVLTYGFVNTITRPEMITVALELPQPTPVIAIYEFGPDEELPPPLEGFWYTDNYQPYVAEIDEPTPVVTKEDVLCMAKNIYFESRTQSTKGQLAVGLVTMNRVDSSYWPDTVCGVVYQHLQFSWYWDGLSDRPEQLEQWETALILASALLAEEGKIEDFTYGSDHYHADYVEPKWRLVMVKVTQIEQHIFYRYENRIF